MNTYTDEQRIAALAALEANGGNVKRTAAAVGIPRSTLQLWRDSAVAAAPELALTLAPAATVKTDWADLFGEAAKLGAQLITENLQRYAGTPLKPSELRDVAVVSGIAVDKHLDYRDGRKSASVTVDARSVNLTQLTDEQLARLNSGS